jgi:hypothetical protein
LFICNVCRCVRERESGLTWYSRMLVYDL